LKKIIPYILLSIFLFNTIGYYVIFKYEQRNIKNNIISELNSGQINNDNLITLALNEMELKNVEWLDDEKEMRYNDHMYDVVRIVRAADKTIYFCIDDHDEGGLFSALENHIDKQVATDADHSKRSSKELSNTLVKLYFTKDNRYSFSFSSSLITCTIKDKIYFPIHIEISSPPPELAYFNN
jgi:hypothetical protein